jgi:hypothetical protein
MFCRDDTKIVERENSKWQPRKQLSRHLRRRRPRRSRRRSSGTSNQGNIAGERFKAFPRDVFGKGLEHFSFIDPAQKDENRPSPISSAFCAEDVGKHDASLSGRISRNRVRVPHPRRVFVFAARVGVLYTIRKNALD